MATTDAITILNDVSRLVLDPEKIVFNNDVLLTFLNAGQVEAVTINPKVNAVESSVQLAAGIAQSIPSGGIMLLDVKYNTGAAGTSIGAIINKVARSVINKRLPNWTRESASGTVKAYIFDENQPTAFDVYPPQPATGYYVKLVYSKLPTAIANYNEGTKITIGDQWANALMNYVAYRCFSEPGKEFFNPELRDHYYQHFLGELGITSSKPSNGSN